MKVNVVKELVTAYTQNEDRIPPKQVLIHIPFGIRGFGRQKKSWRDQLHLEGVGTGSLPHAA